MLSISIVYNVISYKKNQKKACLSRNWTSSLPSIISTRISFRIMFEQNVLLLGASLTVTVLVLTNLQSPLTWFGTIFCVWYCNPWSPLSHCAFPIVRALSRLGGGGGGLGQCCRTKMSCFNIARYSRQCSSLDSTKHCQVWISVF